jgi:serine/threonine-protein kinase
VPTVPAGEKKVPPPPNPFPTPVKTGPPGLVTIDSSPTYAVIFIDGKRYGETPIGDIKLSPGRHSVRAVSPSGASKTIGITVESGKTSVRRIEW